MTEDQRQRVNVYLGALAKSGRLALYLDSEGKEAVRKYQAEFERMRTFIANLHDETGVFMRGDG